MQALEELQETCSETELTSAKTNLEHLQQITDLRVANQALMRQLTAAQISHDAVNSELAHLKVVYTEFRVASKLTREGLVRVGMVSLRSAHKDKTAMRAQFDQLNTTYQLLLLDRAEDLERQRQLSEQSISQANKYGRESEEHMCHLESGLSQVQARLLSTHRMTAQRHEEADTRTFLLQTQLNKSWEDLARSSWREDIGKGEIAQLSASLAQFSAQLATTEEALSKTKENLTTCSQELADAARCNAQLRHASEQLQELKHAADKEHARELDHETRERASAMQALSDAHSLAMQALSDANLQQLAHLKQEWQEQEKHLEQEWQEQEKHLKQQEEHLKQQWQEEEQQLLATKRMLESEKAELVSKTAGLEVLVLKSAREVDELLLLKSEQVHQMVQLETQLAKTEHELSQTKEDLAQNMEAAVEAVSELQRTEIARVKELVDSQSEGARVQAHLLELQSDLEKLQTQLHSSQQELAQTKRVLNAAR